MIATLFLIAVIGIIVYVLITYLPMPEPFKGLIIILGVLAALVAVLGGGFGGEGLHLGRFC